MSIDSDGMPLSFCFPPYVKTTDPTDSSRFSEVKLGLLVPAALESEEQRTTATVRSVVVWSFLKPLICSIYWGKSSSQLTQIFQVWNHQPVI